MGNHSNREIFVGLVFQALATFSLFGICLGESFPANFVFGDSLVDAGNNNYIMSLSKANYVPNGIDFGAPTGRYTNGRTNVDIIGKFLLPSFSFFFICFIDASYKCWPN